MHKPWWSSLFSKCSKFDIEIKNADESWQKCCYFLGNCIWIGSVKLSLLRSEYLSWVANVLRDNPKILPSLTENFSNLTFFAVILTIIKALLCRSQQCLGSFTVFLFKASSETWVFRHLSNHVFRSPEFRKYISYEGHLSFQNFENGIYTYNTRQNTDKKVCFFLT